MSTSKKTLGIFALTMITITSVDAIRNLPATALFGSQLVIFFTVACIGFLLPGALVSAELATMMPKTGGVYVWVTHAFGKRYGLLAIWFQWIENVIWYPAILSFIAGTLAYLISPQLVQNKFYLVSVINLIFWALTAINYIGIKSSARFSEFCGIAGLILPMIIILALGVIWLVNGNPIQIHFTSTEMLTDLMHPGSLVSLTAVILTFSGIEIATAHAQDVKNPQRDYPIALLLSVLVIFVTMLLGSLVIALIVPHDNLSLIAGIMQAFEQFFQVYHLSWFIPIIALCIIIGTLGSVSNWIISPSRGLMVALRDLQIGKKIYQENRYGSPGNILIAQAILVSIITCIFLFMPNINSSYWLLTVLASQLYMGMYILMFVAAVYLRYKHPHQTRPFKIPGRFGIHLIAALGIITCVFNLIIGFFPPSEIDVGNLKNYEITLASGLILMSCPPFALYWFRKSNRNQNDTSIQSILQPTELD